MTGRVQTLRSNVPGNRPAGRQPGELYVNWPDSQLGVISSAGAAQDLIAVRFFSTLTTYAIGDYVLNAGQLYHAKAASVAGAFVPANWDIVADASKFVPVTGGAFTGAVTLPAGSTIAGYLPLGGGVLTGPLTLASNPVNPLDAATKQYVDSVRYGDNRIINGDMRIDQRGIASGVGGSASGYTVDRWNYSLTQAGKIAWQRYTAAAGTPFQMAGLGYCLTMSTLATYAPIASDNFAITQPIEADMISDFAWGTAAAQPVTLSFWAAATVAGTYSGSIRNAPGPSTRSYPFTFVLAANVWTKIIINVPGDTAGAWVLTGNAAGLFVSFDLGMGSTFRGPAGAWAAANYWGASGSASLVSSPVGTILQFTNVKLEVGNVATPFNHQSLAKSLADCQRYYWTPSTFLVCWGYNAAGATCYNEIYYPAPMRATPTATPNNNVGANTAGVTFPGPGLSNCRAAMVATAAGACYMNYAPTFNAEL